MKFILFLFLISITFAGISQNNLERKKFIIGGHIVNRHIKGYDYIYIYPRLSFEYNISKTSSFEFLAEYINHKLGGRQVISYPLSIGYKLNVLPWIIKNEKLIDKLKIYNSFRYTILFSPNNASMPFSNLRVYHYVRYAPGIDYYFSPNWGANFEMVFGQSMKTTIAFGVKFRF